MASILPFVGASRIPPALQEQSVLGWLREAVTEGESFLKSQKGYNRISETMDAVMGEQGLLERSDRLSSTSANFLGKIALDLAAGMTDTKAFWEYRTFNPRYSDHADQFGKLAQHWYLQRFIDMRWADAIKYYLAGGTGWAHLFWNPDILDQDLTAEDPRDVIPIRPASYITIQDAFGVVLRRERTVNFLRHLADAMGCPEKAPLIKPDRDGSLAGPSGLTRAGQILNLINERFGSPFWDRVAQQKSAATLGGKLPVADLYTVYIKDDATNETNEIVQVGDPDQNWSYTVRPGDLLYPDKRRIIATSTVMLYDGPNIYWHGLFPLCKLTLDPWPWSWLGKAPLWDLLPLQRSLDRALRVVDNHNERVGRPGIVANKTAMSKAAFDKIDPARAGLRAQVNPSVGKPFEVLNEPSLDQSIPETIKFVVETMKELAGVSDVQNMAKLGQLPSADTVERILEAMTPAIRQRSRVLESFMREFAMMVASNFAQFYTLPQRLAILGPDGLTAEDFDFDPGTLIPDYVHDEDYTSKGELRGEALVRGPRPRRDRTRAFLRYFTYHVAPGSLLASSEIERKLMYLQLARAGLVDHWTLLETIGIPNVGNPPEGATTITARLIAEQAMNLGMAVSAAGRKASGQDLPRLKMQESG
jgi:hypothetical protein